LFLLESIVNCRLMASMNAVRFIFISSIFLFILWMKISRFPDDVFFLPTRNSNSRRSLNHEEKRIGGETRVLHRVVILCDGGEETGKYESASTVDSTLYHAQVSFAHGIFRWKFDNSHSTERGSE